MNVLTAMKIVVKRNAGSISTGNLFYELITYAIKFLNELYHNETGRYFNHNVHSARVLDRMFARNITLQTHAFNVFTIYCYTNIIES